MTLHDDTLPCGHDRADAVGVEYWYDHPGRYDGISEWKCGVCGERRGRWTDRLLVGDDYENPAERYRGFGADAA